MYNYVEKRLLQLALIGVLGCVLWLLMPALTPFLVAFVLAYLVDPLVGKLEHWGLKRFWAVFVVFALVVCAFVLLLTLLIPVVWGQLRYAIDNFPIAVQWFNSKALPWIQHILPFKAKYLQLAQLSPDILLKFVQKNYSLQTTQQVLVAIAESGMGALSFFGLVVLVPVALFYFLMDWNTILKEMNRILPRNIENSACVIARECDEVVRAFIKGQLTVMLVLAIFYAVGLQLIGIKVALIIGVIAGFFSIVPYLGVVVGIGSALVAVLFQYGFDWVHLGFVLLVFAAAHVLESYILQPYLLGDKIGLSPLAVIFSVIAGGSLGGLVGMLVALPVAAIMLVMFRHAFAYYLQSAFYTGAPLPITRQHALSSQSLTPSPATDVLKKTKSRKKATPSPVDL